MKTVKLLLLIATVNGLSGCGFQQHPAPATTFFLLDIQPESQAGPLSQAVCFRVRPVTAQPPFSGTGLIYRTGEVAYERDYYNQFFVAADQQLGDALLKELGITGR